MSAKRIAILNQGRGKQRGAVLMIMLVIMVMGIAAVLISSLSTTALKNARQETTSNALAQAKDALIGRAVSDSNMPGSLPCPDTNDDGSAELLSGNNCPSYIGRLPWKTLGLPDMRDGSGERLWYALSPAFRDDNSAQPLNSNTKGTLLVYNTDGVSLQTQAGYNAVAVIFSPGSPIGSQTRNTVAQQNSAANYLDIVNGQNNFSASGPFIAGTQSATFNDQFLYITTKDLIPLVEQRVAGEVKRALTDYYTANGYYPWADSVAQSADYNSNEGLNRGWLPYLSSTPSSPAEWCCTSFPAWFYNNEWYKLIYYSVAKNYTANPSYCYYYGSCSSSSTLSVDGVSGVRALFFMPGTPIGTLIRTPTTLSDYLEDSENNDDANDRYVTPTSQAKDRDRLYRLP
jgi:type II secretory pathway pseudopilin PulG